MRIRDPNGRDSYAHKYCRIYCYRVFPHTDASFDTYSCILRFPAFERSSTFTDCFSSLTERYNVLAKGPTRSYYEVFVRLIFGLKNIKQPIAYSMAHCYHSWICCLYSANTRDFHPIVRLTANETVLFPIQRSSSLTHVVAATCFQYEQSV